MDKKQRIEAFVNSISNGMVDTSSILIGGVAKETYATDSTGNGGNCINVTLAECSGSSNGGDCKNVASLCDHSINFGGCDNNYHPFNSSWQTCM